MPFGFVTSEQSTEMRDAASTAGALFLIGKPFTAENFNRELSKVLQEEETDTTTVPLKDWLLCFAGTAKEVATNPLGYASASDIQAFVDEVPEDHIGAYLPWPDGSDELFCLRMFSDRAGAKSLSRALLALGPDDEDLPEDEICDSIGEIINIMAGLVKSHMEAKEIPCKIGLPHYLTCNGGTRVPVVNRLPFGLDPFRCTWQSCAFNNPLPNVGMGRHPFLSPSNSLVIVGVGK